jgi:hypothetical protein
MAIFIFHLMHLPNNLIHNICNVKKTPFLAVYMQIKIQITIDVLINQ